MLVSSGDQLASSTMRKSRWLLISLFYYFNYRRLVSFLTISCLFTGLFIIVVYNNNEELLPQDDDNHFVSMCSSKADRRGLHQNVIAFSLYGNFSNRNHFIRYVDPIKNLIANISQVYPGIN